MTNALQQLADAFDRADVERARTLVRQVREQQGTEIAQAIDGLRATVERSADSGKAESLGAIVDELLTRIWITQDDLRASVLPRIRAARQRYRKFREVHARKAAPGETIVSRTADGRETQNTANAGDYVVRNTTRAAEEYIVGAQKLAARYRHVGDLDGRWQRYQPVGEVFGLEVDAALLGLLGKPDHFYIEAPWGEAQRVRAGDELAAPPDFSEVYRIARAEFVDTYEAVRED